MHTLLILGFITVLVDYATLHKTDLLLDSSSNIMYCYLHFKSMLKTAFLLIEKWVWLEEELE